MNGSTMNAYFMRPFSASWHCRLALVIAILMMLPIAFTAQAASPKSGKGATVTIGLLGWLSNDISSKILGQMLTKKGFHVVYKPVNSGDSIHDLSDNKADLVTEIWDTTDKKIFAKAVVEGKITNLGELGPYAKEEWWVPAYAIDKCPKLPDYRALNDCAKLFASPTSGKKGEFLAGPGDWGGNDEERIKNLKMDFVVNHQKSEVELVNEIVRRYALKQYFVALVYSPHWVPFHLSGFFIDFPPYNDACYETKRYNCARAGGKIWKAANNNFVKKWPEAAKIVRNFKIEDEMMARLMYKIDVEKANIDKVVAEYVGSE